MRCINTMDVMQPRLKAKQQPPNPDDGQRSLAGAWIANDPEFRAIADRSQEWLR
jgi:hypothetical protein